MCGVPVLCDRTASTLLTLLSDTRPNQHRCFCSSICVFVQSSRRRQPGVHPANRRPPFPDKHIQKKRVCLTRDGRDGEFSHTHSLLLTRRRRSNRAHNKRRVGFKAPFSNKCEGQTTNLWPEDLQARRNLPHGVLHFIYSP